MKQQHIFPALLLLAGMAGLCGCSTDELSGTFTDDGGSPSFTVIVSDGGYSPAESNHPTTRTTDDDTYVTTFTTGDRIGVYTVQSGEVTGKNLCLVASATADDGIVWQTAGGSAPSLPIGATYFAYYPYDEELTDNFTPGATTNASTFFDGVIENWTLATDQSTYARYAACDLMVAKGTASGKNLTFPMKHQMSLMVVNLPKTRYSLKDAEGNALSDYVIDAPDTKLYGFIPCRMNDGTYRYIVKPNVYYEISGSYTTENGTTAEWNFNRNVNFGQYRIFNVDEAQIIQKGHTLQVGDFFMKDGTLLSKTEELSDEEKATCIGIVYWVGNPTKPLRNRTESTLQGDKTLANDHPGCTHGLVVSLDEKSCNWQASYTSVQGWLNSNHQDEFLSVQGGTGASDPLNNIQGYNNTKAIEAFNKSPDNSGNEVYVVQEVVDYRKTVPAPAASSGWYVPSEKELTLLCGTDVDDIGTKNSGGTDNRDLINRKLKLISGATTLSSSSGYWSSTEHSRNGAFNVGFYNGGVDYDRKGDVSFRVRFSFAF